MKTIKLFIALLVSVHTAAQPIQLNPQPETTEDHVGSPDLNIRSCRLDANYYYIDGLKVRSGDDITQTYKLLEFTVSDANVDELIPFANVTIMQHGLAHAGTLTDYNGYGQIGNLPDGVFDIVVSSDGYTSKLITGIDQFELENTHFAVELEKAHKRPTSKSGSFSGPDGMEQLALASPALLYPNPTRSQFKVLSEAPVQQLEVYTMGGQRCLEAPGNFQNAFDVTPLPAGNYVVRWVSAGEPFQSKLIIH